MDSDLVRNLLGIQQYLIEEQSGLEFIPISSKDSLNSIYIYIDIYSQPYQKISVNGLKNKFFLNAFASTKIVHACMPKKKTYLGLMDSLVIFSRE